MKRSTIRVLAIDPGLTNTGWVLLEYDTNTGIFVVSRQGEFHPAPTADKALYREDTERFEKRTISLRLLREKLEELMHEVHPDYVVAEGIFFNPLRPTAHEALAMWHCVARLTCMDVLQKKLEVIPTKIAKRELTGSGGNGKITVQQVVLGCKDIVFKQKGMECAMTEHGADAIAVGYAFVKCNRERILNDLKLK